MELRNFDSSDWDIFAGCIGNPLIAEFGNNKTAYVVVVDNYGLTLSRFDEEGETAFVTIEMLPSVAEALVGMLEPCTETIDQMIDDAQPATYTEL